MSEEENGEKPNLNVDKRVLKRRKYKKRFLPKKDEVQRRSVRLLVSELKATENSFSCSRCGLSFRKNFQLSRHISNTHQISIYKCASCNEIFRKKKELLLHSKNVHDKSVLFVCEKCHLSFESQDALSDHEISAHFLNDRRGKKDYKCSKCSDTFEGKYSFVQHMKITHYTPYPCTKCQCTFKYKACLAKHVILLHGSAKKKHVCVECQKIFIFKNDLLRHIQTQHKKETKCPPAPRVFRKSDKLVQSSQDVSRNLRSHKCTKCNETFSVNEQLLKHMESIHENEQPQSPDETSECAYTFENLMVYPYPCLYCKIGFNYEHKLVKHNTTKTHIKKVEVSLSCNVCRVVFRSSEELGEHYRSSHNEPAVEKVSSSFKCPNCSLSFKLKVHLVNHIKTIHRSRYKLRNKENAHACGKCRKVFKNKRNLQRHILSHKSKLRRIKVKKPFKCSQCTTTFILQSSLDSHMFHFHRVAKSKQFKCPKCGKLFPLIENLSKHLLSDHSGSKRFECAICECFFNLQSELDEHTNLTHRNMESQAKEQSILDPVCDKDESSALTDQPFHDTHVECSIPESTLTSNDQLEELVATVHDEKPNVSDRPSTRSNHLKCPDCTISFTTKRNFYMHVRAAHGKPPIKFNCAKCVRMFGSQVEVNRHFELVHKTIANTFQCNHCHSAFEEERDLTAHIRTHHDETEAYKLSTNDVQNYTYRPRPKNIGPTYFHEIPLVRSVASVLRPYKCIYCKATFEEKGFLSKHMQSHITLRKMITFDCFQCNDAFDTQSLLDQHIKSVHEGVQLVAKILKSSFVCKYCDRNFSEESTMSNHVQACHEVGKSLKCSKCDLLFNTQEQLDSHDKFKHAIRIQSIASLREFFQCADCNYFSTQEIELTKHVREKHSRPNPSVFECSTCHECFELKVQLDDHKILHHSYEIMSASNLSNIFECSYCKFVCGTESDLLSHYQSSHINVERYECSKCVNDFSSQMDLDKHVATVHSVIKSLKCPSCEAAFIMESSLKKHIETSHRNLAQKECPECKVVFSSQSLLDEHTLSTHEEVCVPAEGKDTVEFSCYHCPAEFCKEDDWVKHILLFHNIIKPFQCTDCKNYFRSLKSLKEHILAVHEVIMLTGEEKCDSQKGSQGEILKTGAEHVTSDGDKNILRPYLCEECGGEFSRVRELLKHSHSVHMKPRNDGQADDDAQIIFSRINSRPKVNKPYKCSLCKSVFSEKFRLSYHALAVHKTTIETCGKNYNI